MIVPLGNSTRGKGLATDVNALRAIANERDRYQTQLNRISALGKISRRVEALPRLAIFQSPGMIFFGRLLHWGDPIHIVFFGKISRPILRPSSGGRLCEWRWSSVGLVQAGYGGLKLSDHLIRQKKARSTILLG
jgi:hypothetical protein